ncbi:DnaJ heat shock N-terminal domain-containing protein [Trifolium medium]|uniref:DnaJ heat shock N-terminal domain-containing protein n=1 Tax=Trifolium medium TaxID=97028 RepID=A0A392MI89_9FABA|nr:DnaJ heat shock N-terminal domain-containing protein [Trifolium medium]
MNERLVKTNSPVLSDSRVVAEVENLEQLIRAIESHTYPQYFNHLCLTSELFYLDVSRFPNLFVVAKVLEKGDIVKATLYSRILGMNENTVVELVKLHRAAMAQNRVSTARVLNQLSRSELRWNWIWFGLSIYYYLDWNLAGLFSSYFGDLLVMLICISKVLLLFSLLEQASSIEDEQASSDVIQKFDMVEVLDDFVEEHDLTVIPLVKVAGFKEVFHHHFDEKEIKIIPRKEMIRFSNQAPSYILTGEEAAIMLQKVAGCWTQLLLQVNFSR